MESSTKYHAIVVDQQDALKVLRGFREQKLGYPLGRYLMTVEQVRRMASDLLTLVPKWKESAPGEFRGHPCKLISKKHSWYTYDVAVDYFTQYERICNRKSYMKNCCLDDWNNDTLLTKVIVQCGREVTLGKLISGLYSGGVRELALFRPSRVVSLLTKITRCHTSQLQGKNFLDMCSGWGCRLFTAAACSMNYLGFDTNPNLQRGYQEIIQTFADRFGTREVYPEPFQTSNTRIAEYVAKHGLFDICLTSPPFYNLEVYRGPESSTTQYPAFRDWFRLFLCRSVLLAWSYLKPGGHLVIHIDNILGYNVTESLKTFVARSCRNSHFEGIIYFCGYHTQRSKLATVYVWEKKYFGRNKNRYYNAEKLPK